MKNPPPRPRYYRLVGHEVVPCHTTEVWATWFENANRTVRRSTVSGLLEVSTVFLGLDHNWGDGEPLVFETMIFTDLDMSGFADYQTRCSTWAQAEEMHRVAVEFAGESLRKAQQVSERFTGSLKWHES